MSEKLALITGASAGIGREFARILASKGLDLLIVARREARLLALKAELEQKYAITVHCLAIDLAAEGVEPQISDKVREIGTPLGWLVNNAGYGITGRLDETALSEYERFLKIMLTGPVALTQLLLPDLKKAAPAYIINVASVAAFLPGTPGAGVYPACKAFIKSFTETLAGELRSSQVYATASCPGMTKTEIFDVMPESADVEKMKQRPGMSAAVVAQQAINAVESGKVVIVHGLVNKVIAAIFSLIPLRLSMYIVAKAYPLKEN